LELFPFDAEYLRRLIAGEPGVVDHFVDYCTVRILTPMLRNRGVDASTADDIIQETLTRFWEKLRAPGYIRKPEALGALVSQIAKNIWHERYRDRNRYPQLPDDYDKAVDDDPYVAMVSRQTCARVRAVLRKMPQRDAKILIAIWIEGRPRTEVCKEMAVEQSYLRVLIHRANNEFRKRYDDDDDT
jgi:RNA polymerase sigma factor (sigma-70 family)